MVALGPRSSVVCFTYVFIGPGGGGGGGGGGGARAVTGNDAIIDFRRFSSVSTGRPVGLTGADSGGGDGASLIVFD